MKYKNTVFKKHWNDIEELFSLKNKHWDWEAPISIATEWVKRENIYERLGYKTPMQQYLESFWVDFGKIWFFSFEDRELQLITKFNEDPNCMVFTGSLRAAGLGIDLTERIYWSCCKLDGEFFNKSLEYS